MQILQQMNAVQVQLSSVKVLHAFLLPESAAALEKQRTAQSEGRIYLWKSLMDDSVV
jgi:hypothetical protein